ncbi:MAG: hypothetical protein Q8O30_08285 [Candidatus Omnitrophota bacterium]|nr:hypothetical protein [Candidatus Omnitrophota bacterium]
MRYVVNIIALFLVGLLVFAVIKFKEDSNSYPFEERIKKISKSVSKFIKAEKRNIDTSLTPPRRMPLTAIEREEAMRQYVPYVFGSFSDKDWKNFWALIYEPIDAKEGGFSVKRFRTKDEVERILADRYSDPFGYFQENHWFDFWQYVARVNWNEQRK